MVNIPRTCIFKRSNGFVLINPKARVFLRKPFGCLVILPNLMAVHFDEAFASLRPLIRIGEKVHAPDLRNRRRTFVKPKVSRFEAYKRACGQHLSRRLFETVEFVLVDNRVFARGFMLPFLRALDIVGRIRKGRILDMDNLKARIRKDLLDVAVDQLDYNVSRTLRETWIIEKEKGVRLACQNLARTASPMTELNDTNAFVLDTGEPFQARVLEHLQTFDVVRLGQNAIVAVLFRLERRSFFAFRQSVGSIRVPKLCIVHLSRIVKVTLIVKLKETSRGTFGPVHGNFFGMQRNFEMTFYRNCTNSFFLTTLS